MRLNGCAGTSQYRFCLLLGLAWAHKYKYDAGALTCSSHSRVFRLLAPAAHTVPLRVAVLSLWSPYGPRTSISRLSGAWILPRLSVQEPQ